MSTQQPEPNGLHLLFRITGLCSLGDHRHCQARVYAGHDGTRQLYVPCECDCHVEAKAA